MSSSCPPAWLTINPGASPVCGSSKQYLRNHHRLRRSITVLRELTIIGGMVLGKTDNPGEAKGRVACEDRGEAGSANEVACPHREDWAGTKIGLAEFQR